MEFGFGDGGLPQQNLARTYAEFIDGDKGLIYDGLVRTYDDGAGDVDWDFDASGLEYNADETKGSEASSFSITDERAVESQKKQRTAVSPNHGIVFDETWKLADDLEILVKRLKSKQEKDGKLKAKPDGRENWVRPRISPIRESIGENLLGRIYWEESSHDYSVCKGIRSLEKQSRWIKIQRRSF